MSVSYGSLCTGYDGIGMALQLAGVPIQPRWLAENEPAMAKVLAYEHTHVPNVGDIKTAPWSLAPHTDFMSSGDPCQSISIAGRQEGRDDPRFLWPWVRIAYREVRPRWILFENVANLAGHDGGRTLAERHAHLREDGYAVRWTTLGACAVGAPHHRHRYYALTAYVGAGAPEAIRIGERQICGAPRSGGRWLLPTPVARDADGRGEGSAEYWASRAERRGRSEGMPLGAAVALMPTPMVGDATGGHSEPAAGGVRPSGAKRMDSLGSIAPLLPTPRATDGPNGGPNQRNGRGEHDALPGLVVNLLPTPLARDHKGHEGDRAGRGMHVGDGLASIVQDLLPTPDASGAGSARGGAAGREGQPWRPMLGQVHELLPTPIAGDARGTRNATANRSPGSTANMGWTLSDVAFRPEVWGKFAEAVALWEAITGVPAPAPTEPGAKGAPRLSPLLPEWMMGLRPGLLTAHLGRADALKGAGNGVVPLAAAAAYRLLSA